MATISASIALQDKMTPIMKTMLNSINSLIAGLEKTEKASGRAIDTKSMAAAKAEIARAGAAFKELENDIDKATKQQEKFNDSAKGGSAVAGGLIGKIGGVVAAYATLQGAQKILNLSDQYTQTTARLDLMNDGLQSTEELQAMIYKSAQDSRGVYTDTADAVSKMGLMAKDAFSSNVEAVQFMEQINKQYVLAGTSAAGAQAATLQLTQAMASGVLRGEELNSIFEQAPTIIQSISKYLGVPIGQIRAMAAEGQITADIVKQAMFATADETNAKFNSMPKTFEQTWNSFTNMAGRAFQGVFAELSDMANSKELEQFINIAADGVMVVAKLSKQILIAVAAFAAYKTVISPTISIGKAAVLSFKTITGAIAVMTTGATAATPAIASMSTTLTFLTGPVGLAVIAIAALSAGLVALYIKKKNDTIMTKEQIAAHDKFITSTDATIESINSGIQAREQSLRSSELEIVAAKTLADQIFNLSDKQNKSAYELSLLNGYVDQFNQIMPNANLLIDTQTGALNLSRDAVWEFIAAEQERIRIAAGAEMMIANKKAELEATMGLSSANAELARLEAEKSAAAAAALAQGGTQVQMAQNVAKATEEYNAKIAEAKTKQEELTASMALVKTEGDKINQMMADPSGFAAKEANEQAALAATTLYTGSSLEIMEQYKQNATTKANETGAAVAEGHKKGWLELPVFGQQAGADTMAQMDSAIQNGTPAVAGSTDATRVAIQQKLDPLGAFARTTGQQTGDGLIQGLKEREAQIATGGDAAATVLKNSFKSALGINSPSKVFREFGFYAIDGLIQGLSSTELLTFAEGIVADIKEAFSNNNFNLQTGIEFLGPGAAEFFKSIGIGGASLGQLVTPLSGGVTSDFGYRDPFMTDSGQMSSDWHAGIDIGAPYGAAVGAAGAGTVTMAGWNGGYGNTVMIDHGNGLSSMYAHLSEILVSVGQLVSALQTIGLVGSTGNSTGPHLHFGLFQDGVAIDPSALWGYANGTTFATPGLHLVGEHGPEIINMAGGEKVLSAKKTKDIVSSAGSRKSPTGSSIAPIFHINIKNDNTINSELDIKKVSKALAAELEEEIQLKAAGMY